jgi:hypothetical protein
MPSQALLGVETKARCLVSANAGEQGSATGDMGMGPFEVRIERKVGNLKTAGKGG